MADGTTPGSVGGGGAAVADASLGAGQPAPGAASASSSLPVPGSQDAGQQPQQKMISEAEVTKMIGLELDRERARLAEKWKSEQKQKEAEQAGQFRELYEAEKAKASKTDALVAEKAALEEVNARLSSLLVPPEHRAALEKIPLSARAGFVEAGVASGLFAPKPPPPAGAGTVTSPPPPSGPVQGSTISATREELLAGDANAMRDPKTRDRLWGALLKGQVTG